MGSLINERYYGDLFEKSEQQFNEKIRYNNLLSEFEQQINAETRYGLDLKKDEENEQLISEKYGTLFDDLDKKTFFARRYGNLLSKNPLEWFSDGLNKMKELITEYEKRNTQEYQKAIQELKSSFVNIIRQELEQLYFVLNKCISYEETIAVIFGSQDECNDYIKQNAHTNQVDFREFMNFYGDDWKKIENYHWFEKINMLVFIVKKK